MAGIVPLSAEDVLPIAQAWVRYGLRENFDAGIDYSFPLTVQPQLTRWWRVDDLYIGAHGGGGVHALPEVAGLDAAAVTPFASAGVIAARTHARRAFASLRAFAPLETRGDFAAALWLNASVGADVAIARWHVTPVAGAVLPAAHPENLFVVVGLAARRRW